MFQAMDEVPYGMIVEDSYHEKGARMYWLKTEYGMLATAVVNGIDRGWIPVEDTHPFHAPFKEVKNAAV